MERTVEVSKKDAIQVLHVRLAVVLISVICICIYMLIKANPTSFIMGCLMVINGYVIAKIEEAYRYEYKKRKKIIKKKEVKEDEKQLDH